MTASCLAEPMACTWLSYIASWQTCQTRGANDLTQQYLLSQRKIHLENRQAKRENDQARTKTRVNLGFAFKHWKELREFKGFKTGPDLSFLLLKR